MTAARWTCWAVVGVSGPRQRRSVRFLGEGGQRLSVMGRVVDSPVPLREEDREFLVGVAVRYLALLENPALVDLMARRMWAKLEPTVKWPMVSAPQFWREGDVCRLGVGGSVGLSREIEQTYCPAGLGGGGDDLGAFAFVCEAVFGKGTGG